MDQAKRLLEFMDTTIDYFLAKLGQVDRDRYFADRDSRNILDKTINDIILCMVDIAEECLKRQGRSIPDTYKDTILGCYEFMGESATKVAPLVKHRNEMIHEYLKISWQNIVAVKNKISDLREFTEKAKALLDAF